MPKFGDIPMLRSLHALKSLTLLMALAAVPAPGVQAASILVAFQFSAGKAL
jgi:hypothetical protein